MRPHILFPLFAEVSALPGVGPKVAQLIEKLAGPKVVDLLWHLPSGLIDRRHAPTVADAEVGRVATLTVRVEGHIPPPTTHRAPYRVRCADDTGTIDLIYFHGNREWLTKILPVGATRVVSGRVDIFQSLRQIAHPDYVEPADRLDEVAAVEPVYPMTAGLAPKTLARAVAAAVERAPDLPE